MGTERKMTERDRYTSDHDTVETHGPPPGVGPCLLAPQTLTAVGSPYYTPTIDMKGYEKCLFDILGGVADDADCSLAIRVLQSTTASATLAAAPTASAKALSGLAGSKRITDSALGNYSYSGYYFYKMNRKWLIEVDVEEMDVDALFRYLQLEIIVGSEGTCTEWVLAIEAIRSLASYEPCPQTNVDQVVA